MSGEGDEKSEKPPRKERVLHTRVPAVLEQELKRVANAWRVPVSNVVRALLEDALDTLDIVGAKAEDELRGVAEKLQSERHKIRQKSVESQAESDLAPQSDTRQPAGDDANDLLRGAVGVTPITLVHDTTCELTGARLNAGTEAFMVLFDDPRRKLITGRNPLPSASTSNEENADD
jgi:hypothetical protein